MLAHLKIEHMSCLSATLTNAVFVYLCICVFASQTPGNIVLRSLYHHLSENIWFVWSKTPYSGDKRGCHQAGRTTTNDERRTTMEDSATQPLGCWKAEFRNMVNLVILVTLVILVDLVNICLLYTSPSPRDS